jgi:hypothetical protein
LIDFSFMAKKNISWISCFVPGTCSPPHTMLKAMLGMVKDFMPLGAKTCQALYPDALRSV